MEKCMVREGPRWVNMERVPGSMDNRECRASREALWPLCCLKNRGKVNSQGIRGQRLNARGGRKQWTCIWIAGMDRWLRSCGQGIDCGQMLLRHTIGTRALDLLQYTPQKGTQLSQSYCMLVWFFFLNDFFDSVMLVYLYTIHSDNTLHIQYEYRIHSDNTSWTQCVYNTQWPPLSFYP